ncbi:hypothetical protein GCM10020256_58510 [Streptomyces thermocoprophilus]
MPVLVWSVTKICRKTGIVERAVAPSSSGGDGDVAPAEDGEVLVGGDGFDLRGGGVGVFLGEEGDADGVAAGGGQVESGHFAEEGVGDLGEDARTVTGVRLGAGGATVLQVAQDCEGLLDQGVGRLAGEGRDEADAAGVVLVAGGRTYPAQQGEHP